MIFDSPNWHEDAECAKPKNAKYQDAFFANKPSQQNPALRLCAQCPVRQECLKWGLETKQVWGIWGGLNYKKIRRTLSINWDGQEMRHKRFPLCPYCNAKTSSLSTKTVDRPTIGRWATMRIVECSDCKFSWQSRTSANAVDAYHSQESRKKR
jgi:WhiB family transcriptional regulator, redox-sensing transcriptional regulator